jgi:DNA-binding CsgD family transcriptional regulator/N-acetylneuraminic acid mutarotase
MSETSNELSEREREILRLVVTGASNKEIARQLFISTNTVKVHLRNIFAKIGVSSRTEAAMYSVQSGLVPTPVENEAVETLSETMADAKSPDRFPWQLSTASITGILLLFILITLGFLVLQLSPTAAPEPTPNSSGPHWLSLAPMSTSRYNLATAAIEGTLFAIGGKTSQGVTGLVEAYDIGNNTWRFVKEKPTPVEEVGAAVIGGKIYVPGGRLPSGQVTDIVEVYDPMHDNWAEAAPLPQALSAYALAAYEGRMYLFGGWDGKAFTNVCFVYDPELNSWARLPSMPTRRGYLGAAVAGRKIYLLGGFDGQKALAANEIFQPDLLNGQIPAWSEGTPLPEAIYQMGTSSIADIIYVLGGKGPKERQFSVMSLQNQNGSWQAFEAPKSDLGEGLGVTSQGLNIYAIGGSLDEKYLNTNQVYQAVYTISFPIIVK